jgi:aspartyl-tRNA(Asn)/glutamyl-tRNA(Gln) amidotransferase subunit A
VVRHFHEADNKVSPAVQAGIDDALAVWASQGAEIVDVALPSLQEYQAVCWVIMIVEAYALHEKWMQTSFNDYGELFRDRVALGGLIPAADYVQAVRRRRELLADTFAATKGIDAVVTAGAPAEAPRINAVPKWGNLEKASFTNPFNVTGWPALCVCSGFGEGGLPVSVQIASKPFTEATLFRIGHAYETARGWRTRRPSLVA